jgi:predicted nucleic acid-binding protein
MEIKCLVIDADIIFASLIKRSFSFELVRRLSGEKIKLYSPAYLLDEISKHMDELEHLSGMSRAELEYLIEMLCEAIEIVPKQKYEERLKEAEGLLPEHRKNVPYLALALKLDCPIWSGDKRLTRQTRVRVFSTKEMIKLLGL